MNDQKFKSRERKIVMFDNKKECEVVLTYALKDICTTVKGDEYINLNDGRKAFFKYIPGWGMTPIRNFIA